MILGKPVSPFAPRKYAWAGAVWVLGACSKACASGHAAFAERKATIGDDESESRA
jgi:hypothetical protein